MSENKVNDVNRDEKLSGAFPDITKEFMEKAMKRKIRTFQVHKGSNPGDNFTSVLYGVEVVLEECAGVDVDQKVPLHLLIKLYPNHPVRQKFLDDTNLFWKECLVYNTLLPEFRHLQKDVIKNSEVLKFAVPLLINGNAINYKIATSNEGTNGTPFSNYILMQDVRKTLDFQMTDKLRSLDFDHCALVLKELAKLHALGLAYKVHMGLDNLTSRFPFLAEAFLTDDNQFMEPVVKSNFEIVMKLMENEPSLKGSEAIRSFRKLEGSVMGIFKMFVGQEGVDEEGVRNLRRVQTDALTTSDAEQWIVAGHGDCWINNMLFRYDKNSDKPLEVMLVDLQMFREGCLTLDLVYFFYTSTDHILRAEHLASLLEIYAVHFLRFCKVLKTPPFPNFSLHQLQKKFHRAKVLGFLMATLVLPVILTSPENSIDLEEVEVKEKLGEESWVGVDFTQLLDSMTVKDLGDQNLIRIRFAGMIKELYQDGVL